MYRGAPQPDAELWRRRFLGCLAIAGVFLAAFALNGWRATPVWRLFETRQGTFAAGDAYGEWIYAVCDGEEQQVTVLRDGRVEGAAALDSLRSVRFPNWCDSLPTVDNPELADWQAKLGELEALTASSASAAPILEAAERMPVSVLYLKPISEWLRDESHAASFLDTIAQRPMKLDHPNSAIARTRRSDFAGLIGSALDVAARGDVTPAQLEQWLASRQITASGGALQKLAKVEGLSDSARLAVLERLEGVRYEERTEIYLSIAADLAHEPAHAMQLVERLRLLPRERRLDAARQLLAWSEPGTELPLALLSRLREFSGRDTQLEMFQAIAGRLKEEDDAPLVLSRHLDDLRDAQERRLAATYLLGLDARGETAFARAALGTVAELHPMSRQKFLSALMQSPQFADRSVQEACLLAIQLRVQGPAKTELLAAMLRQPALDRDLLPRITAELGGGVSGDRGGVSL